MLIVLMAAAFVGGLTTFVALWPLGWLIALAGVPFGGSFLALMVAVLLALRDSHAAKARSEERLRTSGQILPLRHHLKEHQTPTSPIP
jgi:hypothetical protein